MSHANGSPSRRTFLQTSAAAAGAALTTTLATPGVYAGGSDAIKVGVIGCGGRGSGAADNVLHSAKGVQVIALGDVFKDKVDHCRSGLMKTAAGNEAKALGNSVDIPDDRCYVGLDAFQRVIDTPGVNYIILATPPGFRPPHLQAAIAAGKNIFCEKPVGVDGPGIRKVFDAYEEAKKKNLFIAAGTQRRHQAGYIETMKRIHDGEVGDITAARAYWNGQGIWFRPRKEGMSDLAYQLNNWYHFLWLCGDHIVEQHVHNLDVCNWALGTHPLRAVGMGGRSHRQQGDPNVVGQIFDHFAVDYEYPNGVHMMSMCRQIANTQENVSEGFACSKGMVETHDGSWKINGKSIESRAQGQKRVSPYVQEHTDLIECIRTGKPINELKNVAESTLTAILGRMATYTGKMVTWEQALNSKQDTMPPQLSWDMSLQVDPAPVPGKTKLV
jgi:predicted dehydrogenase